MEIFKTENLTFSYPTSQKNVLENVNLSIKKGEFVCLCGKSGSGKTTLLKLLKPTLSPFGNFLGEISFCENDIKSIPQKEEATKIGFVMQDVENQLVTDKVWHELAFGLESLGIKTPEIRKRVAEMASFFGIDDWFHKRVDELSGGQKQILNLASVMVLNPEVLILDEPTAQLDPIASGEFLQTLEKINKEFATTIIISEHRLEDVFPISERVLVMDNGKIVADGSPRAIGKFLKETDNPMFYALPTPMQVYGNLTDDDDYPVTIKDGRAWLECFTKDHIPYVDKESNEENNSLPYVVAKNVWFRYEKNSPDILKGIDLTINRGEIFSVVGGNGNGKTTLLSIISGINKPYRGKVTVDGQELGKIQNLYTHILGVVPQNPKTLFTQNTVLKELFDISDSQEKIDYFANLCKIDELYSSHPYDLSGGEQQRLALCKVLLKEPEILLLDEPTKGFDAEFKEIFAQILKSLKDSQKTIIMVSHDIEFCARVSDRCSMIFDGVATVTATPKELFSSNSFYTTSANKMARGYIDDVLLAEDIVSAFGVTIKKPKTDNKTNKNYPPEKKAPPTQPKKSFNKNSLISMFFLLLTVPLTVFFGHKFLGDRKYYFVSLLVILETIISFLVSFERKKPSAKELVIISVLCALTVCGRLVFAHIPQFKPVLALIIISGVCFGAETGFLVGAMSAFVSNFFFGQGPWTPYQMFVMGIIGFLAGAIFNKKMPNIKKLPLSIFGFLSAVLVYGVLMNSASFLMAQGIFSIGAWIAFCSAGLPLDIVLGVATALFLWLAEKPMIEKLERIKKKYGI